MLLATLSYHYCVRLKLSAQTMLKRQRTKVSDVKRGAPGRSGEPTRESWLVTFTMVHSGRGPADVRIQKGRCLCDINEKRLLCTHIMPVSIARTYYMS